jgi:hypothetical protein
MTDVTRAEFVSSGPIFDGETIHDAMSANIIHHLAGHLLSRRSPAPGHGFEHEPLDDAEKASQHTVQNAATFDHAVTSAMIRAALRPGN